MTVAELAKRFERGCAQVATPQTPGRPSSAGRVKELTKRLEQAVGTGTTEIAIASPHQSRSPKPLSPPREREIEKSPPRTFPLKRLIFQSATNSPAPFPSPPPLPPISHNVSNTKTVSSSNPLPVSLSPLYQSTTIPSAEKLHVPAISRIIDESKIIDATPNSVKDTPAQLSVSERLAVYEKLSISQDSSSIPNPIRSPSTPSTGFTSNSSAVSSQRHGPLDLIPDVSEGDLDDIEGVERVEDEASVNSAPTDDDENATFRRAKTVQTLSSADSQSSHHSSESVADEPAVSEHSRSEPDDLPSNPSTPSNASDNSSFSSAEFTSAAEEFPADRPAPHTLAIPPTRATPRHDSNLSSQPHTLQIAPGSFKKLPKAKVMIARRKGQDEDKNDPRTSKDDVSTRKLIREYEHPKELLEGSVSLVELDDDDDDDDEIVEFRDPEVSDVKREASMIRKKKDRVEAFRHRYDELMDPQEIEQLNDDPVEEGNGSSSKERYQRRRLFRRGKVEKARQREVRLARQRDAVTRRSTVISGALDRVSLAADPWIDFITDTNTLPVTKAGGGIRRGLKRLFGFGRQNQNAGLIKSGK